MTLIDDARKLAAYDPSTATVDGCMFCSAFGHAIDCPWRAMPRIVAALEAALEIVEPTRNDDGEFSVGDGRGIELWVSEAAYDALVAAMKDDGA